MTVNALKALQAKVCGRQLLYIIAHLPNEAIGTIWRRSNELNVQK